MRGAKIVPDSLKTKQNNKKFQNSQYIFLFFKSNMTLLYLLIIDFPKFDPLTETGIGQNVKIYSP